MGPDPAPPAHGAGDPSTGGGVETQYRLAFESAPEAIVLAQDGRLRLVNRAAETLIGRSRSELLTLSFAELIHPDDRATLLERYERRLGGDAAERRHTFRLLDASGATRWVEAHSMPSAWQGRPAVLAFFAEVTEREDERRAAAELAHMLHRIAELSPYFIFVYDYELGRDVFINRSVPLALGYSMEEARAMAPYPFAKLCHPDDYTPALERDERWRGIAEGAIDAVDFRLRAQSGEWRWFHSLNTPFFRDERGRVRQILGVSLDVTDQRRNEETLRRGDRLESIGLLAGGLAHDFGNLLTPILGHTELLLRKLAAESPLRTQLETVHTAAERAAALVDQLLVVSGRGHFRARPVALDEVVVEVAGLLEPILPANIALRTEIANPLPEVAGDAGQLRQVILNLVTNARDVLTPGGGIVQVRARPVELDDRLASALDLRERVTPGPVVLLEVEDDGPGMDESIRNRLWEPFFTTKPQGRGLGLASVVGIVRRHRGGLAVDSVLERGTIFRIFLPLADRAVAGRERGDA